MKYTTQQYWNLMREHSMDGYDIWDLFVSKFQPLVESGKSPVVLISKLELLKVPKKFQNRLEEFNRTRDALITGFRQCKQ